VALRILLVEDQPAVGQLLERILVRDHHHVDRFVSAADALAAAALAPHSWDTAIIDLTLPDLAGDQLAGRLLSANPALQVLLISGFPEEASSRPPNVRFLQKPFSPSRLLELLAVRG